MLDKMSEFYNKVNNASENKKMHSVTLNIGKKIDIKKRNTIYRKYVAISTLFMIILLLVIISTWI